MAPKQDIVSDRLVLSRHVRVLDQNGTRVVVSCMSDVGLKYSSELVDILNTFVSPRSPVALQNRYSPEETALLFQRLMGYRLLVPEETDEELTWLNGVLDLSGFRSFETEQSQFYHVVDRGYLARRLAEIVGVRYSYLLSRGFRNLNRKTIIVLPENRDQLKRLWGATALPECIAAFVVKGRILVVDSGRIGEAGFGNDQCERLIGHELVHVFLHDMTWGLPIWLEEGLCEYFSRSHTPGLARGPCRGDDSTPLTDLEAMVSQSLYDLTSVLPDGGSLYRRVAGFVAHMAETLGDRRLLELVVDSKLDEDFRSRFEACAGERPEQLEREWRMADRDI